MGKTGLVIFAVYLAAVNIAGFIMMLSDKRRAASGRWRIREAAFFAVSLLGGSLGTLMGMYAFRHKTKHMSFVLLIPLILIIQTALLAFLFAKGIL